MKTDEHTARLGAPLASCEAGERAEAVAQRARLGVKQVLRRLAVVNAEIEELQRARQGDLALISSLAETVMMLSSELRSADSEVGEHVTLTHPKWNGSYPTS